MKLAYTPQSAERICVSPDENGAQYLRGAGGGGGGGANRAGSTQKPLFAPFLHQQPEKQPKFGVVKLEVFDAQKRSKEHTYDNYILSFKFSKKIVTLERAQKKS